MEVLSKKARATMRERGVPARFSDDNRKIQATA
jgi:hypothetical protein